jgi:hypothetical protein
MCSLTATPGSSRLGLRVGSTTRIRGSCDLGRGTTMRQRDVGRRRVRSCLKADRRICTPTLAMIRSTSSTHRACCACLLILQASVRTGCTILQRRLCDPSHKDPNGERFRHPSGDVLDFHKGRPGLPGWRGKDHWHHNGGDEHLKPGDEVDDPAPICSERRSMPNPIDSWFESNYGLEGTVPFFPLPFFGPLPSIPFPMPAPMPVPAL